jgi:hypothetical protein
VDVSAAPTAVYSGIVGKRSAGGTDRKDGGAEHRNEVLVHLRLNEASVGGDVRVEHGAWRAALREQPQYME